MRISRLTGRVSNADTTLVNHPNTIDTVFEADASVTVGNLVALDTGNTAGKLCVTVTTRALQPSLAGVYQGEGGSGADTTTSGLSGKHAVDGDIIFVRSHGVAVANVSGTITDGLPVVPSLTSSGIIGIAAPATDAGPWQPMIALASGTTGTAQVYCRLM